MRILIAILILSSLWTLTSIYSVDAQSINSWTATVLSKSSDTNGNQVVALHFADGSGHVFDVNDFIPFGAVSTQLNDFVAATIANLTAQQTVLASAPAIGLTVTPTASNAVTDPNAAVKATFAADYLLLREYQTAISHGLITTADLGYIAQLAKVTSEFSANESVLLSMVQVAP